MKTLLHDQHLHSSFSNDSEEDLRNYFIEADKLKIPYIMTCEHLDFATFDGTNWIPDFDNLIKYQNELKKEFPNITPLLGLELGYKKDYLDDTKALIEKYDFDLIQLSIHDGKYGDFYFPSTFQNKEIEVMNYYFDLMEDALTNFRDFDSLSHIDFGFKTIVQINPKYKFNMFEDRIKRILKMLVKLDKPLEVNSKVNEVLNNIYIENDSNYHYDDHLRYLLSLYKECGGTKLTLSSDAHKAYKYRLDFDKHIKTIKEMGFNKLSYFIKRKEYYYDL